MFYLFQSTSFPSPTKECRDVSERLATVRAPEPESSQLASSLYLEKKSAALPIDSQAKKMLKVAKMKLQVAVNSVEMEGCGEVEAKNTPCY